MLGVLDEEVQQLSRDEFVERIKKAKFKKVTQQI